MLHTKQIQKKTTKQSGFLSNHRFHSVFRVGRLKCTDFDRNFLVLVCSLGGEDIGNFGVGSGLPADSTLYSFLSIANTVLLHNDGNALITETVSTGEHGPLSNTNTQLITQARATVWLLFKCTHITKCNSVYLPAVKYSYTFLDYNYQLCIISSYLLTQRASTDRTWLWIQTSCWFILWLKQLLSGNISINFIQNITLKFIKSLEKKGTYSCKPICVFCGNCN